MGFLLDIAYAFAGIAALPFLLRKSSRTGKYRTGLAARLGLGCEPLSPARPGGGQKTLLLHCVSVGELNSVQTLIHRLLETNPSLRIVLTTTTDTGTDRARKLYSPVVPTSGADALVGSPQRVFPLRFPFDFSFAVERFLNRTQPDAIALVELETWPNFLATAAHRGIPVAILNGRISERSYPRYQLIRPLMANMLQKIRWIGAQTDTIAARFTTLGAHPARLQVIPTLKYDNATIADQVPGQDQLAAAIGLAPEHRLFVAGSIGPGEEIPLLQAYTTLKEKFPHLRLALAPRHPEVVPQVIESIKRAGLTPILRTERPDAPQETLETRNSKLETHQIFLLNTMGELRKLYALAFAVFVGRSLCKKSAGGSDMIEVAALAKPACFGPHTANFAEVVELLTRPNPAPPANSQSAPTPEPAALIVHNAADLTATLDNWLSNEPQAQSMGRRAQSLIRAQQQARATDLYITKLRELLGN